ncbi:alpha/beta hydrolase [Nocardioides albidus]|uniref:Alpha/beta hydrolase n=2 Tax=Nocardioides albidus TaxID=1517589 RepID=A0A5C4VVF0_9ACTN|nr:alpha/beta hydrolase [Nocardioides albidus]
METWQVEVDGGTLHGLRWGSGDNIAVAVHGITANAMSWQAVAEALPDDWSLVAIDLRGRGRSRDLPEPYDAEQHARDIGAALVATGARVLVGHSLGAYLAASTNHLSPGLVDRLVLVDGGLPLPVPAGVDPDELLALTLGPALERLRQTWPDEEAYVDFFRAHPAMGPYWTPGVEAYARYDALPISGGVSARAVEKSVRVSGRELLTRGDEVGRAITELDVPTDLLVAERGMFDQPGALMPDEVIDAAVAAQPLLRLTRVPDTNHYTILFAPDAAAAVAAAIAGR